ncbi:MAG: DUF4301 family protein [Desulfobacteraceae bacterium]|nr:MAG: DUF4301 family protein [Desulfobacteraceae bacterium]
MEPFKLHKKDAYQIKANGLTEDTLYHQLATIEQGAPFTDLVRPCTVGDGIQRLSKDQIQQALMVHETEATGKKLIKFVPASGAATRMFKHLTVAYNSLLADAQFPDDHSDPEIIEFVTNCHKFAFYEDLKASLSQEGLHCETLLSDRHFLPIFEHLISDKWLHYTALPKGSIKFHDYETGARTAFEEHLVEGAGYARPRTGECAIHFTVSPQHQEKIVSFLKPVIPAYEDRLLTQFHVSFSTQKNETNTIAVDLENRPYRQPDGSLLFRPGGHGALIDNLNTLDADVVFIKNIDNVAHERYLLQIVEWKKILCGLLIQIQQQVFRFLEQFHGHSSGHGLIPEAAEFVKKTLSRDLPDTFDASSMELKQQLLIDLLNRPLRICGMVPNAGDPGGGPFWTRSLNGETSLQIVETSQIDTGNPHQLSIANKLTHFNPVDLVCGIKNWRNKPFDLSRYVDDKAVFIANKTEGGHPIKALELPGLWNGAMAFWNTVFVEVPPITFNPVKEVTDLLRKGHQPAD